MNIVHTVLHLHFLSWRCQPIRFETSYFIENARFVFLLENIFTDLVLLKTATQTEIGRVHAKTLLNSIADIGWKWNFKENALLAMEVMDFCVEIERRSRKERIT